MQQDQGIPPLELGDGRRQAGLVGRLAGVDTRADVDTEHLQALGIQRPEHFGDLLRARVADAGVAQFLEHLRLLLERRLPAPGAIIEGVERLDPSLLPRAAIRGESRKTRGENR